MNKQKLFLVASTCVLGFFSALVTAAQHPHAHHPHAATKYSPQTGIEPQPLLAQALRLREALSFLGSSLSPEDEKQLEQLQQLPLNNDIVKRIQDILDPYCLFVVDINPEGRVKVDKGIAPPKLSQGGWTSFLVKVMNDAGGTAQLEVESANTLLPLHPSSGSHAVKPEDVVSEGQSANRFLDAQIFRGRPLHTHLSGLKLEYAVVQLYSKDAGKREAEFGFNVGQGSQDIGFRNTVSILLDIRPSVKVKLRIKDDDGAPVMASFTITDSIERTKGRLSGVYPLPSRRVAAFDEYPDFFFQKQVYRTDGEHVLLPPGKFHVSYTRGPEYIPQQTIIEVPEGADSVEQSFQLKRWINMAKLGWFSGDHHIHAAGCAHYDSPEEGVQPKDMWRQVLGEDLKVSAVLGWGPSWYHQKQYFTGVDHPLSNSKNLIRYDVEVSGFPSSHAGHIVLLRLKEDDYPGTTTIEEWPSWTLPILQWAKSQGGIVGYAHSGWGLAPIIPTRDLPNYVVPKMDYIGANEFIVTVAHGAVDFYSAGDTPYPWELNMWYHTLNCNFRTTLSGETDFPCITDERVGQARSYYKSSGAVNYDTYIAAIKAGRSYISDGWSHIMDFSVNKQEVGTKNNELKLKGKPTLRVAANVAAYLPETQSAEGARIAKAPIHQGPYWHVEKARIGESRNVAVELIVNGEVADTTVILADGRPNKVQFNYPLTRSGWVAVRVLGSAHSNPIFVELDGKPVSVAKSAQWCVEALDQCWKKKETNIRSEERAEAKSAYDKARAMYEKLVRENPGQ